MPKLVKEKLVSPNGASTFHASRKPSIGNPMSIKIRSGATPIFESLEGRYTGARASAACRPGSLTTSIGVPPRPGRATVSDRIAHECLVRPKSDVTRTESLASFTLASHEA